MPNVLKSLKTCTSDKLPGKCFTCGLKFESNLKLAHHYFTTPTCTRGMKVHAIFNKFHGGPAPSRASCGLTPGLSGNDTGKRVYRDETLPVVAGGQEAPAARMPGAFGPVKGVVQICPRCGLPLTLFHQVMKFIESDSATLADVLARMDRGTNAPAGD